MEASAAPAPAGLGRVSVRGPLLRLRSDEQLLAQFRAGNEDAFAVIHDRYRVRLGTYARQMLSGSEADAEDVLQDVFLRAYRALRADERPVSLRAWLYRVAHNRCIDQIRPSDCRRRRRPRYLANARHTTRAPRPNSARATPPRRRPPPATRSAALGAADARDRRHELQRARRGARHQRARDQVAAGPRARSASSRPRVARDTDCERSATTSPTRTSAASAPAAAPAAIYATAAPAPATARSSSGLRRGLAALSPARLAVSAWPSCSGLGAASSGCRERRRRRRSALPAAAPWPASARSPRSSAAPPPSRAARSRHAIRCRAHARAPAPRTATPNRAKQPRQSLPAAPWPRSRPRRD